MCGIAGFYSKKGVFDAEHLKQMTQKLSHRGPDATGTFFDKHIGLGHRRLSIIDLSAEANQPMFSQNGKFVLVFNGEIYNFKEIAKELNYHPKTSSDTEIILAAFQHWGPEFVNKINGMFAMAIYSIQKDVLYLFRDRLGIKPLFYFINNNQLAFASELKALVGLPFFNQNKAINQQAVYRFLNLGYIPAPDTIYQHTYKFPQGQYAIFDGKTLNFQSYWSPEDKITKETIDHKQEAKETLKDKLKQSVKYRLVSDVPYGTFLSGGVDSSLISALAQKETNHQLKTFSIGFNQSKFNESGFARKVAEHIESDHHELILTEEDALEHLPYIFESFDEPFADSSAIPTMLVSKMARQQVTMTLSGDGGDELFHGYGMYNWAERLNPPWVKNTRYALAKGLSKLGNRFERASKVFTYEDEEGKAAHIFSQEQYFFSNAELEHLLQPKYNINGVLRFYPNTLKRNLSPAEKQAFFDLKYYLPDDLLTKVDRASMRYSLESRVPLLDHEVVEFALNLSPGLKRKGNEAKYLLKQVLYDYVPEPIFNRPKWGFSIPLGSWLKTNLKPLTTDYLNEKIVKEAGFVEPSKVKQLLTQFYLGNKDFLYNRIWALICLHRWYYEVYLRH